MSKYIYIYYICNTYVNRVKSNYNIILKNYFKSKNTSSFLNTLSEYETFLKGFYDYKYYYTFDIFTINQTLLPQSSSLTPRELRDINLICLDKTIQLLFNDIKYRKCDDIFLTIKFDPIIWDKSAEIIFYQEKITSSSTVSSSAFDNPTSSQCPFLHYNPNNFIIILTNTILSCIGTSFTINETNYTLVCLILIIILLIISIILMLIYYK